MRRMVRMLFLSVLIACLFACNSPDRVNLSASESVSGPIRLTAEELGTKLEENQTFALLITSELCSTCQQFQPLLESIISDRQILIYEVVLEEGFDTENPYVAYQFTPTFVLFIDGEETVKIDPISEPEAFDSVKNFENFLKEWILLS